MASIAGMNEALDKPNGEELQNPRVEVDAFGQEWTITATGGRLKRGGTIGPGRPKDAVKEQLLRNAMLAAQRDAKILANKELHDGDTAVEKAKDRSMKAIGDEVTIIKDQQLIERTIEAVLGTNPHTGKAWIAPEHVEDFMAHLARTAGVKE